MKIKAKDFIEPIKAVLGTDKEKFEFETPGEMSSLLYVFRKLHPGGFISGTWADGRLVWGLMRPEGMKQVQMTVAIDSTTVDRTSLIEIHNIIVNEVNDYLWCKFGAKAKTHELIQVDEEKGE